MRLVGMRIKVGPVEYVVTNRVPKDALGCHGGTTAEIALSEAAAPGVQRSTLVHELVHAVWHVYGLPDSLSEEDACDRLGVPWLSMLRDNPHLVAALAAHEQTGNALHAYCTASRTSSRYVPTRRGLKRFRGACQAAEKC